MRGMKWAQFKYYGGNGIKLSERWENFNNFKEDNYENYLSACKKFGEGNVAIVRTDKNGDFCPGNIRFLSKRLMGGGRKRKEGAIL